MSKESSNNILRRLIGSDEEPPVYCTMTQLQPRFPGKCVIVTGASRGIGEDAAFTFARAGASVVLVARTKSQFDAVESRILEHVPNAQVLKAAVVVIDPAKVEVAVTRVVERFGGVDVLVAAAGTARSMTVGGSIRLMEYLGNQSSWCLQCCSVCIAVP
ncbi:hypothetical protein B0F90DRAFT_1928650 [Multifurca ochricompacta]|uniref:Uncharacterized protein n=1 Tax=Multifurca ochricompacta TaxID=376703 RepID=A0AAD4LXD4_9AGAM|nr:hypothetical protein B0F90DRAFT_1928650 [Multifurca ochricompacta]